MGKHITGPACRADMIAASLIFSDSLDESKDIEVSVRDATNARSMLRDMGIPYTQKASNAFQFNSSMDYENALSSFDDSGIEVMESRDARCLVSEGTWSLPFTKQKATKLLQLMAKPLMGGPGGPASKALYPLLGSDSFFDEIDGYYTSKDVRGGIAGEVEDLLRQYAQHPEHFRDKLDDETKKILMKIAKFSLRRGEMTEASDMEKELQPLNRKLDDLRQSLASASGDSSKRQVRHQIQSIKMQIQKVTRKYLGGDF